MRATWPGHHRCPGHVGPLGEQLVQRHGDHRRCGEGRCDPASGEAGDAGGDGHAGDDRPPEREPTP